MGNNCSHHSPSHANAVRTPTEIDAQHCGGQEAVCDEDGRGAAGLGRTRTTR